jgi:glucose/arabinose dehydrogenase
VAENLTVPWSIVFTDPTRMLVSERTGGIKQVVDGKVDTVPLITFSNTAKGGEIGLMGLVLDPEYLSNRLLYACLGYSSSPGFADQVIQLKDTGSKLEQLRIILDDIPAASNHAGCELAFGPDGKLYVSTGDATEKNLAQDMNSLGGKILRINSDGSIPSDNPFPNSPIYTFGHRNPQGIDWTSTGVMYAAEHGPSGNDGPGGGDEINHIIAGANYGWPLVSHQKTLEGTISPLITYTPAEAPSSLLIYSGSVFPQFKDTALVATLRGQGILWLQFDPANPDKILNSQKLDTINVGRVREVTEGPDGYIYFTSSNTDGRGTTSVGDDKIYHLVPVEM